MWFPFALIAAFALAFLGVYLAERRNVEREAAEREEDAWRVALGKPQGLADVTPDEGGVPQPAPLRSRRVPIGDGSEVRVHVAAAPDPSPVKS